MSKRPVEPLLLDFPDQFETKRLVIRAPRPGDGPAINEAIRESHEALHEWMPWARTLPSVEESEAFVRQAAAKFALREDLPMLLFRKEDGLFAGASGMHSIDWNVPRFEIGYWLRSSLLGQGYMTEAVEGITRFAFDLLHAERIEIRMDARNRRSAAVAERAGYVLEARLKHQMRGLDGSLRDTLVYVKLRGEPA
ncbi:MAG: GNAT family N-acetyltransferase [Chloroflexota bacterium]|nr:MAG: GNAT family N-acetyltransferase [Chloroflexota bacterium]